MNNQQAFIKLVKEMRDTQKRYFRFRDPVDLEASRRLEKKVDNWLKSQSQPTEMQGRLLSKR